MPEIGEIRKAREIGRKGTFRYIWYACEGCGFERWTILKKGQVVNKICKSCALRGKKASNWKGGKFTTKQGYVLIWLSPSDFFFSMAQVRGYVLEHRLVIAKKLGRCLQPWEIVHHLHKRYKDIRNKSDNLEDNLQLVSDDRHKQISILEMKINKLLNGQRELKAEIRLLRLGNKSVRKSNGYECQGYIEDTRS